MLSEETCREKEFESRRVMGGSWWKLTAPGAMVEETRPRYEAVSCVVVMRLMTENEG